jgi:hypothetical protein
VLLHHVLIYICFVRNITGKNRGGADVRVLSQGETVTKRKELTIPVYVSSSSGNSLSCVKPIHVERHQLKQQVDDFAVVLVCIGGRTNALADDSWVE